MAKKNELKVPTLRRVAVIGRAANDMSAEYEQVSMLDTATVAAGVNAGIDPKDKLTYDDDPEMLDAGDNDERSDYQRDLDAADQASINYEFTGQLNLVSSLPAKYKKQLAADIGQGIIDIGFNRAELNALVQELEVAQKSRIQAANRLRAMQQGVDMPANSATISGMKLLLDQHIQMEQNCLEMVKAVTDNDPICCWANEIVGIGPRLSAPLRGAFDPEKAKYASSLIQFVGYNIQNAPRYNDDNVQEILEQVCEDFGIAYKERNEYQVTDEVLSYVSLYTGRSSEYLQKYAYDKDRKRRTWAKVASSLKRPYYSPKMRKHMYLITDQFNKRSGPSAPIIEELGRCASLYGHHYRVKRIEEIRKNEDRMFADQAAHILATRNIQDKKALEYLKSGRLTPIHIEYRARRKAGTLFLHHYWGAMFLYEHPGELIPLPYQHAYEGHQDFIEPEVPYDKYLQTKSGIWMPVGLENLSRRNNNHIMRF